MDEIQSITSVIIVRYATITSKKNNKRVKSAVFFLIGVKKQKSKLQDLLFGFNLFKVIL